MLSYITIYTYLTLAGSYLVVAQMKNFQIPTRGFRMRNLRPFDNYDTPDLSLAPSKPQIGVLFQVSTRFTPAAFHHNGRPIQVVRCYESIGLFHRQIVASRKVLVSLIIDQQQEGGIL